MLHNVSHVRIIQIIAKTPCPCVIAEKQPNRYNIDTQAYDNPAIIDRSVGCTMDRAQSVIGQKNRKHSVFFTRGHGDKGKVKKKRKINDSKVFSSTMGVRFFFLPPQRVVFRGVCKNCLFNTLSSTDNDDDYSSHRFRRIIIGQLDSRTLLCCYYFAASFESLHPPPDDGLYQPHHSTCHQSLTLSKVILVPLCDHPSTFSLDTGMAVNVPFSTNRHCRYVRKVIYFRWRLRIFQ